MTSCGYRFSRVLILLNCPCVSTFRLWLHLMRETFCCCTGWLLLGPRLVSDTRSCDPCHFLSLRLPLFMSCFFLVFHTDWDVTYIFIVIRCGSCLYACHHISILFQGCCNSLIVLVIQLFDKSPKFLILPFKDAEWLFWFSIFSLKLVAYACEIWPHLHYNGCS